MLCWSSEERFLPITSVKVFSIRREKIDPVWDCKVIAQREGVAFCIRPSPSGWPAHLCKSSELSAVEESSVSYVLKCRWDTHFLRGSAKHESLFAHAPQLEWKPNVFKIYAMRESGSPYGVNQSTGQVNKNKLLAIFTG